MYIDRRPWEPGRLGTLYIAANRAGQLGFERELSAEDYAIALVESDRALRKVINNRPTLRLPKPNRGV